MLPALWPNPYDRCTGMQARLIAGAARLQLVSSMLFSSGLLSIVVQTHAALAGFYQTSFLTHLPFSKTRSVFSTGSSSIQRAGSQWHQSLKLLCFTVPLGNIGKIFCGFKSMSAWPPLAYCRCMQCVSFKGTAYQLLRNLILWKQLVTESVHACCSFMKNQKHF